MLRFLSHIPRNLHYIRFQALTFYYVSECLTDFYDKFFIAKNLFECSPFSLLYHSINPSLYERQSFWAVLIGGFFYWTSFNSVNQTMVQRYMSLPTLKKGQHSIVIFTFGVVLFLSVCCFAGLLVFDFYRNCDPLNAGLISVNYKHCIHMLYYITYICIY